MGLSRYCCGEINGSGSVRGTSVRPGSVRAAATQKKGNGDKLNGEKNGIANSQVRKLLQRIVAERDFARCTELVRMHGPQHREGEEKREKPTFSLQILGKIGQNLDFRVPPI